jgi:hypothetical protein
MTTDHSSGEHAGHATVAGVVLNRLAVSATTHCLRGDGLAVLLPLLREIVGAQALQELVVGPVGGGVAAQAHNLALRRCPWSTRPPSTMVAAMRAVVARTG